MYIYIFIYFIYISFLFIAFVLIKAFYLLYLRIQFHEQWLWEERLYADLLAQKNACKIKFDHLVYTLPVFLHRMESC